MDDLFKKSKIAKSTDYLIKFHTLCKRLKTQESILKGNTITAINNLKNCDLSDFVSELEYNSNQYTLNIDQKCSSIKHSLEILKENVLSSEKIQNLDVEIYKKTLIDLENQLSEIKLHINNEKDLLQTREKELCEEIKIAEKLMNINEENMHPAKTCTALHPSPVKMIRNSSNTENKDVRRFQNLLQKTGGHTGGWGDVEHNAFLKCWLKCNNTKNKHEPLSNPSIVKLVEDVQKLLPGMSKEEVVAHNNWFLEYRYLKEMQTKSLQVWKALRDAHQYHKKLLRDSEENAKAFKNAKPNSLKSGLEIWKKNKEYEKKVIENDQVNYALIQRKTLSVKESDRKLDKEAILKWSEAKKIELETKLLREEEDSIKERERKAHEANRKIKEFRQRDQLIVNNRKVNINKLRKIKSCDFFVNRNRIIKRNCCCNVTNISGQYDKPTEQWCRRIKKSTSVDSVNFPNRPRSANGVDFLPKLGVPKWRQGITMR